MIRLSLLFLLLLGCERPGAHEHPDAEPAVAATTWTCPMHPTIQQASPGSCPICGMDLVPVSAEQKASGEVIVDGDRRQKVGIVLEAATVGPLSREIRAFGNVQIDQNGQMVVTTKVDGLVRDAAVVSVGQTVRAGQRLFSLWSPELQAAQAELVAARDTSAAPAARARLERWDVPAARIQALLEGGSPQDTVPVLASGSGVVLESMVVEGARVMAGEPLYRLARLDPIWVEAAIYAEDVPFVSVGATAELRLADQTGALSGVVSSMLPEVDPMTRARRVRISVDNPSSQNAAAQLLPGMAVDVLLQAPLGEVLSVPADAVIFTGTRRLVFVDLGEGRLAPREVQVGARAGDRYVVLSGLSAGEQVVREGTFLVAAESRIRSAAGVWGHDHAGQ